MPPGGVLESCHCQRLSDGMSPRCDNCRFGVCSGCSFPNELDCRRHAPVMDPARHAWRGVWPLVVRAGLCGDYERR